MENLKQDNTLKVMAGVLLFFSAMNGIISVLSYLEEKEIARKQLKNK